MNWELAPLDDLLEVQNGYAFDSKKFTSEKGWPLIRIRDLKEGVGTEVNYSGEFNEDYIVNAGDLLIGMDGEFRCYDWKGAPALLNQRVCRLRNFSGLMPRFLMYGINKYLEEIEAATSFTTVKHLSSKTIKAIEFPHPPLPEQQRIVGKLDAAFAALAEAQAHLERNRANARELFESYLNGVFDGKEDGWNSMQLKDLAKFIDYRGRTPKKTSSGLRLITAKNVRKGHLKREPEEFIAEKDYDSWMTRGIPEFGDVLFTTEAPLANVAQLDTQERVVFAQRIIILQPKIELIDKTFLKYALLSGPMQAVILSKGTGATVSGIKAALLKLIEVPFPKLQEQRTIVELLESLEEKARELEATYQQKL
ncbi:MAG: restriction endonuclease subunit S, partial [Flavobacteriales bacterium]